METSTLNYPNYSHLNHSKDHIDKVLKNHLKIEAIYDINL